MPVKGNYKRLEQEGKVYTLSDATKSIINYVKWKMNMGLRSYSNKRIITRITAVLLVVSMLVVFGCGKTK